ncbi:MAG: hypothetical protein HC927_08295, partial [Deltaproteobacteria bacterium]|nr:hypothetical protein [Deltaproteobacteria bacterium]
CRNQHRLWAVRDLAYLRWRFDDRPDSGYLRLAVHDARGELVGFAVLAFAEREQRMTCFIMDLVVDSEVPRASWPCYA